MILGVDTGGTFTDFVLWREGTVRTYKVLSTPDNPARAILQGIREMGLTMESLHVVHGSTVATNAVLEGKLARTVFITNHGLKDLLTIGRQVRRELYNLTPLPVAPPVPPAWCLEVSGRISAEGELLEPFDADQDEAFLKELESLEPQAVAINLLFSFLDSGPERHIESLIPAHIFVSRSSSLLPVYREYERGMTTWLNAATGPLMKDYLQQLIDQLHPATLTVMQSSADTVDAEQAGNQSVRLLLSGPAGGLQGAQAVARQAGYERIMTFDMGGTSSDVALIDGEIRLTDEGCIGGYPVAVPMVDMHTIGAGGGSLAWLDQGGLLHVGPQSAGAYPGPACYGQGGLQSTVTDANVVLGRLPAQVALGGSLVLDQEAAQAAINVVASQLGVSVEEVARGILNLANEHMASALRVISVEKGYDPKQFILVSFGGAGGLHVCDLSDHLGMSSAMVPMHAGVLSAYGMLVAPRGRRYMQTMVGELFGFDRERADHLFEQMAQQGRQSLLREGLQDDQLIVRRQVDIRYIGQSSCLLLDWQREQALAADFHQQHERRFGHSLDEPLEIVNLHCAVLARADPVDLPGVQKGKAVAFSEQAVHGIATPVPVYDRKSLGVGQIIEGPVLIVESSATTWVKPGWRACPDDLGNLMLERRDTNCRMDQV